MYIHIFQKRNKRSPQGGTLASPRAASLTMDDRHIEAIHTVPPDGHGAAPCAWRQRVV